MKYNAVLRRFPASVLDENKGNNYVNTITAAVSGIKKLSVVAPLPRNRTVWRGVAVSHIVKGSMAGKAIIRFAYGWGVIAGAETSQAITYSR